MNQSATRRRKSQHTRTRFLVVVFAIILVSGLIFAVNHLVRAEEFKSQTRAYVTQATQDIPHPDEAELVYQRFFGSTICQYTGREFVYTTNLSPEEARDFYAIYLNDLGWPSALDMVGRDKSGRNVEWLLFSKSLVVTTPKELTFKVMATTYDYAPVALSHLPKKVLSKIATSSHTVYSLVSVFRPDKNASVGCPSFNEQYIGWWETE